MTDIYLEILLLAPSIFFMIDDRIDFTKWDLPRLVQWDLMTVLLPVLWAYTVFLYRWIILWEDLSLILIAQVLIGGITTWARYEDKFRLASYREEVIEP